MLFIGIQSKSFWNTIEIDRLVFFIWVFENINVKYFDIVSS